ncbi:MAG: serine hydrolase [Flammeovirgaceae bacterium]|nr:MAG: serine hydrolase [Flammeovirgaceae bacterium]
MQPKCYFTLSVLFFVLNANAVGQVSDSEIDKNTATMLKRNTGKIVFIQDNIEQSRTRESDFLNTYTLTDSSTLYFRFFINNSLVKCIRKLEPSLDSQDIEESGSFQITYFVDNKKIYTELLFPSLLSSTEKNEETMFTWSIQRPEPGFLWTRFLLNGGEEVLTDGKHVLKLQIHPYWLKNSRSKTGSVIAKGEINLQIVRPHINNKLAAVQTIEQDNDWKISSETYDKEKIEELNRKILQNRFKKIKSIVVIKSGQLLIEEYFNGSSRDSLHDTRSVGKTFGSALMGIAISDGYIKNIDQTLSSFYNLKTFSNYSTYKDSVSLRQLITMTSAFKGNDDDENSPGNESNMYDKSNWVEWTLNLPIDSNRIKNRTWAYFTAGSMLLGDIINKSVPGGMKIYADNKLFMPLGISNYKWVYTPQNVPSTAGGIRLRSLDMAKFGFVYQNKGIWNQRQIIPKNWVEESLKSYHSTGSSSGYGYLWWQKIYEVSGKKYETYFCTGNGGNKIYVFREIPVVIVIAAEAFNTPYMHLQADRIVDKYLLPSLLGQ